MYTDRAGWPWGTKSRRPKYGVLEQARLGHVDLVERHGIGFGAGFG